MKEITKNSKEFIFPNYCFTKFFRTYYFLTPRITNYYSLLFEFLENLRRNFHSNPDDDWRFFAVGFGLSGFKKGDVPPVTHNFQNIEIDAPIKRIEATYSDFKAKYGWDFIWSYRIFWMDYHNKIQVYVNDDAEIVVIGVDLTEDMCRIEKRSEKMYFQVSDTTGDLLNMQMGMASTFCN